MVSRSALTDAYAVPAEQEQQVVLYGWSEVASMQHATDKQEYYIEWRIELKQRHSRVLDKKSQRDEDAEGKTGSHVSMHYLANC